MFASHVMPFRVSFMNVCDYAADDDPHGVACVDAVEHKTTADGDAASQSDSTVQVGNDIHSVALVFLAAISLYVAALFGTEKLFVSRRFAAHEKDSITSTLLSLQVVEAGGFSVIQSVSSTYGSVAEASSSDR